MSFEPNDDGRIIFSTGDCRNFVSLEPDGTFSVKGVKTACNKELYHAMREFFLIHHPKYNKNTTALVWEPIETAPKDGREILGWSIYQTKIVGFIHWNNQYKSWAIKGWGPVGGTHNGITTEAPTHWAEVKTPGGQY